MKQKFKHETFMHKKCVNSILRYFELATKDELKEGMNWYQNANGYCKGLANRFNVTIQQAGGIIAAFSPQTGWEQNKRFAVSFLLHPNFKLRSLDQFKKAKNILALKSEADI